MADSAKKPPIIIKRISGHGGHHGGAWKVAYADFVTAMMALFIVLWLMNSSEQTKEAIAGYFNDPKGFAQNSGTGQAGAGDGLLISKDNMSKLKEELQSAVSQMAAAEGLKDQVEMTVTGEGLRIELLESEQGTFFASGVSDPTGPGSDVLQKLAQELGKLPNDLSIEGHTDSRPFNRDGYTNWELSTDRANSARRLMQATGLRENQVKQVRGYADQRLRSPDSPDDAANRRISVIVQYRPKAPEAKKAPKAGEHGESGHGGEGGHGEAGKKAEDEKHGEGDKKKAEGDKHGEPAKKAEPAKHEAKKTEAAKPSAPAKKDKHPAPAKTNGEKTAKKKPASKSAGGHD